MSKKTIKKQINYGIKTFYKSRLYRSLLEAKWAAFFDLLEWEFEYEPYELNDRITGIYDGEYCLKIPSHDEVIQLWNRAVNKVQWNGGNNE